MFESGVKVPDAQQLPLREQSRQGLLLTAERLFAQNGLSVSLRQIAAEAGHRNPAAIQYHFGSKAGLYRAIIEHRLPDLNRRRLELLDALRVEGREHDLRGLAEAMARPLLELDGDAHYVGFLARMNVDREALAEAYEAAGESSQSGKTLARAFDVALRDLPPALRANRRRLVSDLLLNGIANRRARQAAGRDELDEERFADDLIAVLVGALAAPR